MHQNPRYGVFNTNQRQFIVCSEDDIRFVDLDKTKEIDLDDQEDVEGIEAITTDEEHFYILANKRGGKLGYYLFEVN